MPVKERSGIVWFLAITFGLTWGIEGLMLAKGVSFTRIPPAFAQYIVAGLMWAPAIGAALTRRFVLRQSLRPPEARLRIGSLRPYAVVLVLMPVLFAAVYGLTLLLGLGRLDLSLKDLLAQMAAARPSPAPEIPKGALLAGIALASVLFAPFINTLFAFGEEYGWRGFLLPRLLPLGRARAHLLGGVIWGLWHAPLILMGFNYPGHPWAGIVWMCALTTLLGVFESEWTLRYGSIFLASFIHGAFNAQAYGIWRLIVPQAHPLSGGFTGILGLAALAVLAIWSLAGRVPTPQTPQGPPM
jgi:uncharacterized protein